MNNKENDGWLSTRNKTKVTPKLGPLKRRSSLPIPRKEQPAFLQTQGSLPPVQLFTSTKQSTLTSFFKATDDEHLSMPQYSPPHVSVKANEVNYKANISYDETDNDKQSVRRNKEMITPAITNWKKYPTGYSNDDNKADFLETCTNTTVLNINTVTRTAKTDTDRHNDNFVQSDSKYEDTSQDLLITYSIRNTDNKLTNLKDKQIKKRTLSEHLLDSEQTEICDFKYKRSKKESMIPSTSEYERKCLSNTYGLNNKIKEVDSNITNTIPISDVRVEDTTDSDGGEECSEENSELTLHNSESDLEVTHKKSKHVLNIYPSYIEPLDSLVESDIDFGTEYTGIRNLDISNESFDFKDKRQLGNEHRIPVEQLSTPVIAIQNDDSNNSCFDNSDSFVESELVLDESEQSQVEPTPTADFDYDYQLTLHSPVYSAKGLCAYSDPELDSVPDTCSSLQLDTQFTLSS